jgi:hypothetical protein
MIINKKWASPKDQLLCQNLVFKILNIYPSISLAKLRLFVRVIKWKKDDP